MKLDNCIKELANNAQRICVLVENVSAKQARWKPNPDSWSMLEVVNHLLDEEKLDFRVRLDITLRQSGEVWPAINPLHSPMRPETAPHPAPPGNRCPPR